MVPLYADCLLRCASDLDGAMETTCDRDPIKTAMEQRQARERERYQRQTAFAAYRMSGKSSCNSPYRLSPKIIILNYLHIWYMMH